jgi:hypothetical protein
MKNLIALSQVNLKYQRILDIFKLFWLLLVHYLQKFTCNKIPLNKFGNGNSLLFNLKALTGGLMDKLMYLRLAMIKERKLI